MYTKMQKTQNSQSTLTKKNNIEGFIIQEK